MSDRFNKLHKLVEDEALFVTQPSLKGIDPALDEIVSGAIYLGSGLSTPSKVSIGLPFDILSMMLLAEKVRQSLGLSTVYHHIADTHAASNEWITPHEVVTAAVRTQANLKTIVESLGLKHYKVVLSSDFDTTPEYVSILNQIHTDQHEYVKRELADIEWYRQHYGVCIKLGWIIQEGETSLRFDERLFDREYRRVVDASMSFLYVQAGRTFDKQRPKAPPYIHIDGESRIVLRKGEDVVTKMKTGAPSQKVRQYFQEIVRLYNQVIGGVNQNQSLELQIQSIIENIFRSVR